MIEPTVSSSVRLEPQHRLIRQLRLRDLVLAQVLNVVGSSWVGIAAGIGHAQFVAWLLAFALFYVPMAVSVFQLNRIMPLEGGLYEWARRAYGDTVGFMTAWNIWAYALTSIATILFQLPSELAYMLGPAAAGLPDSHPRVLGLLTVIVMLLTSSAVRGLNLGKWIHNTGGIAVLLVFTLLILSPLWVWLHGAPVSYTPVALHLPPTDLGSLALLGQVLFAACGLEYIAIMAGETEAADQAIGQSVLLATPIILAMFVLGTASVVSLHGLNPNTPINYVAPIPQTLTLAFGGQFALIAKIAILLLQIRILGAASLLFTGATRLPMTAGWDHLVPEWFTRLHPRYRTPTNSIYLTGAVVVALLVLASAGVHAAEAFGVLNDASSEFYALAYLAMFLIPIRGASSLRDRLPRWMVPIATVGVGAIVFIMVLNAYPFVDVASPGVFAAKIIGAVLLVNGAGFAFYRSRQRS
jgi:amino acid transporter